MFLGLDWHVWITIILVIGMFITMLKTELPADLVFMGVMALLIITGCLPTEEALSGFSSSTVMVVAILYIVVAGLEKTGVLHWIVKHLLGNPTSYWKAIVRMMLPVALLSSVLTNTTVVALFIKVVKIWAKKLGIEPSKLLIPLSYAAGMGGVCTMIGSAPNLIIADFYAQSTGKHLGLLSTTVPGLLCLTIGILSIIAMQKLLPNRKTPEDELKNSHQGVITELYVLANSHLPGQTLGDIRLNEFCTDCKLIGIVRFDGEVVQDINDDEFLMGSDTLLFTGNRESILNIGKRLGLECAPIDKEHDIKIGKRTLVSSLIMMGMVMLSAFNIMPLLNSCFIAAFLMLITRCCNIKEAKKAINWDVLIVFACSICLGKAIDSTGLAEMLASNVQNMCGSNAYVALCLICFIGTFMTEFVSNAACGAIMAPVAIKIATAMGANPLTFCIGLIISVSSSFATPIGSTTHLMVYVPGGYRFTDFVLIGLPMNFIILAANILAVTWIFPL